MCGVSLLGVQAESPAAAEREEAPPGPLSGRHRSRG